MSYPQAPRPPYAPPHGYRPYGPPPGYPPAASGYPPQQPPGGGYAPASAPIAPRPQVRHTSHTKVVSILVAALLVAVGAFVLVSKLITPGPNTTKICTPTCGGPPPVGKPVVAEPRFVAGNQSWSVEYPDHDPVFTSFKKTDTELVAELAHGAAVILVAGGDAGGKTAQQVVQSYLSQKFPDADLAYEISHAEVGYTPGYGAIFNVYPQTTSGAEAHNRLVVLAAVKNNTYVLVVGYGVYRVFTPGELVLHPSGAAAPVAVFMDPIINSVKWKGDVG